MNLQEKIEDLRKRTLSDLLSVADEKTLNNLRTVMLGKKRFEPDLIENKKYHNSHLQRSESRGTILFYHLI